MNAPEERTLLMTITDEMVYSVTDPLYTVYMNLIYDRYGLRPEDVDLVYRDGRTYCWLKKRT